MKQLIGFHHVGVTVPDVEAAATWYVETLGFELLVPPVLREDITSALRAVFGDGLQAMWIAHLQTPNGIGLEMFSFATPATEARKDPFEYRRTGPNHLCPTVRDLEVTVSRIEASGGRLARASQNRGRVDGSATARTPGVLSWSSSPLPTNRSSGALEQVPVRGMTGWARVLGLGDTPSFRSPETSGVKTRCLALF
jgi:catechol 2,3-dioxygenase-like lactoylglutathione lyase family enzyme